MGGCESSGNDKEVTSKNGKSSSIDHPPVPLNVVEEVKKYLCTIIIKTKEEDKITNGFFIKTQNYNKYLVAKDSINPDDIINEEIELKIYNHKTIKLDLKECRMKYFPKPKDITLIKIKKDELISNEINFLLCDFDIDSFRYEYIFSIKLPIEGKTICQSGKIIHNGDFEFFHNIPIDNNNNTFISPIMLLYNKKDAYNNINEIKIIGISKNINNSQDKYNSIFIGGIINENNEDLSFGYDIDEILHVSNLNKFEIKFISYEAHIEVTIPCKREDTFSSVEEKLYEKFPELKYKNLDFYKNNKLIRTSSTLIENDISNGDKIEFR